MQEELRASGWYRKVWQGFAVLLPLKTVGVMGDGRTYEHVIALRIVESLDAMTADWGAACRRNLPCAHVRSYHQ